MSHNRNRDLAREAKRWQPDGAVWTDGTGTTTGFDRHGVIRSIVRDGRPVATNKYGERLGDRPYR